MNFAEPPVSPVTKLLNTYRSGLLDFDQLQNIPEPTWLIDRYLMNESVAILWGDPGAGKSFIALDWAMSIATGSTWFNQKVRAGNVLYIVGEGVSGMKLRANAWVQSKKVRPYGDELLFLRRPVPLLGEHAMEVVTQLAAEQCSQREMSLIIVDTLARAVSGHSENDSTDMGLLIEAADTIREQTKATVLFVHHSNRAATGMRGSSALKGGIDTEIEMTYDVEESIRKLLCRKQKDASPFAETSVFLHPVANSLVPAPWNVGLFN